MQHYYLLLTVSENCDNMSRALTVHFLESYVFQRKNEQERNTNKQFSTFSL